MPDFFRFPHTPHIVWLGKDTPRDDKVLTSAEAQALLTGKVVVEEKLDGANTGFSLGIDGSIYVQNRGQYLVPPYSGQFTRLPAWMAQHGDALYSVLTPDLILFGEWCVARHTLDYTTLPDWFLLFDVYDRSIGQFWSTTRRNLLAEKAGLVCVPQVTYGQYTVEDLKVFVANTTSRYRQGSLEGVVVRRESSEVCESRGKLVRQDFVQAIDVHWRNRYVEFNRIS